MAATPTTPARVVAATTVTAAVVRRGPIRSMTAIVTAMALALVGAGITVCAAVEAIDGGDEVAALALPGLAIAVVGGVLTRASAVPARVSTASAFAAVAWSWVAVSVAGAVPFVTTGTLEVWHEALFESVSGFTCSGSTVIADIEAQGAGILFWRSMTHWLGGMGLVVLAVAVLPLLRVGGLELVSAEAPGPATDRLTPRVRETAKRLWLLYGAFTLAVTSAFVAGGMSLYDGVAHAFAATSTGGFSTKADSISGFDSAAIEVLVIVAMVIGGASFTLHWKAVRGDPGVYRRASEMRLYLAVLVGATALLTVSIFDAPGVDGLTDALRQGAFNAATVITSCGFGTSDFTVWGGAAQFLLLLLMIPAGMTGSTSGGMKLLRVQVLFGHAFREVVRARHARAVVPVRLGTTPIAADVVDRVVGFAVIYSTCLIVGGLAVTALGVEPVTGFSGAVSAMGNIGPALGEAGPSSNFLVYPAPARAVLMALMLLGRLELFAVLFMFTPAYRRAREHTPRRGAHLAPRQGTLGS